MSTFRAALVVVGCLVLAACGGPSVPQDPAEIEARIGQVDASLKEAQGELTAVNADIEKNLLQQQQIRDSGDAETPEGQEKLSTAVGELQTLDARKEEVAERVAELEQEKAALSASLDQAKADWAAAEDARMADEAVLVEQQKAEAAAAEEQRKAEAAAAKAAEDARKAEEEAARAAAERKKQEEAALAAAEAEEREKAAKAAAEAKKREDEALAAAEAAKRQQEEAARAAVAARPAAGAKPAATPKGGEQKTVRVEPHTTEDYLYEEVYADLLRAIRAELEYYEAPLPKRAKAEDKK